MDTDAQLETAHDGSDQTRGYSEPLAQPLEWVDVGYVQTIEVKEQLVTEEVS